MQALILQQPGQLVLTDTTPPGKPGPGEALVRVRRVGVCGTDLHAYRGNQPFFQYPRILGHELGVEVVQVGAHDEAIRPGDRCAVEPYLNCGTCSTCRRGKTNCCPNLRVLGVHTDGGMREYITVPVEKLHRSDALSLERLALVEMLSIGAHAVRRAEIAPGETALVVGAGPIGLSVATFARLAGAQVVLLERSESRLQFCLEKLGFEHAILANDDAIPNIRSHFGGDLPAVVFEATGNAHAMMRAFEYVAHGGRLILVGLVQGEISFHDPDFHRRELTLLSSRNATATDFREVIRALEQKVIDLTPWISVTLPLARAAEAFPAWLDPANGTVKAMLTM